MRFRRVPFHWLGLFLACLGMQVIGATAGTNATEQRASLDEQEAKAGVWSNWEGTVTCHPSRIFNPTTIEEVQSLVKNSTKLRPVGFGHSFNRAVCADTGHMLQMTSMNKVLELNTAWQSEYVRTQPGVTTRQLLDWLRERGYTLATYPYFIDQTIGGAISTGSHGSSTKIGSLSSLLLSLKMVTANSEIVEFTAEDGEEWEAARVSVGLLGVIVELQLRVVKDEKVWKVCDIVSGQHIQTIVDEFVRNPEAADSVNILYDPKVNTGIRTSHKDKLAKDDKWVPLEIGPIIVSGGHVPLSQALLTQPKELTALLASTLGMYDQSEYFISQELASGCFQALREFFTTNPFLTAKVAVPMLIRFVKEEGAHLSACNAGARLCINMDDYDSYHFNTPSSVQSETFNQIKALMRSPKCLARIHFGKASVYSAIGGDWTGKDLGYVRDVWGTLGEKRGEKDTGDLYERFKQIAMSWDPEGKFRDGEGFLE